MRELNLSAELRLLVDATLGNEPVASTESLKSIRWKRLTTLVKWHQVRPLLFDFLPANQLPEEGKALYESLKDFALGQAVANMAFMGLSVRLYDALQKGNVQAFPMKGALWAWMLYKKPTSREFGDIDYFIERNNVRKSLDILAQSGFLPDAYRSYLLKEHEKNYLNTDYQLPLEPAGEHTLQSLEVQWNISYPRYCYNLFWDDLARDMIQFKMMHTEVTIPKMEHQLLMMVVHHGGVEQWDKLKYLGDFVRLLRLYAASLDWIYITEVARSRYFFNLLVQSLHLVRCITREDYLRYLPAGMQDVVPDNQFIDATVQHWENSRPSLKTKTWQIFRFNFRYRDGWKCRLALVGAHISYLLQWRLIWAKWKWYRINKL